MEIKETETIYDSQTILVQTSLMSPKKTNFGRIVLVHDTRSNDSRSVVERLIHMPFFACKGQSDGWTQPKLIKKLKYFTG